MVYHSVDEWLEERLIEAKKNIEKHVTGYKLQEKIYIVNTRKGNRAYHRYAKKIPVINAHSGWDSEYGSLEQYEGKNFIFLNDILVSFNWVYGDVMATLIHEILHIIWPQASEKEVKKIEGELCKINGIKRENTLEHLS